MSVTASHMREHVYPHIDAAELLNSLSPRHSGKAYRLDCPSCEARQAAFYYPGSSTIICNRRDKCGASWSIWDLLLDMGWSSQEVVEHLHSLAGVPIPDDDDSQPVGSVARTVAVIRSVLGQLLAPDSDGWRYLVETRGYTPDDIDTEILGFYPDAATVGERLREAGADLDLCRAWDVLPERGSSSRFAQRVVGYWEQPDGTIRLWGRAVASQQPKYMFAAGTDKSRPYAFRPGLGPTVCVEGQLDQYSLRVMGIPAASTGQNQVTVAQARYMASSGVRSILFLADAGSAGYEGIVRTIAACEPLGIVTWFSMTREGCDDVDAMRAAGNVEHVHNMAHEAINAGSLIANRLMVLADNQDMADGDEMLRLNKLHPLLTPESRMFHDRLLSSCGITPTDEGFLMRAAASMCRAGMSFDTVQRQLKLRYGVTMRFDPNG